MIDCPTCHQPNPEGASFCIYCGGTLPDSKSPAEAGTVKGQPLAPSPGTVPGRPASGAFQQQEGVTPPPPPPAGMLEAGTLVDGKYEIDRVLGEGGMGVVYLARDIHMDVPVVVKAIRAEYAHREEFRRRILAEGRALATIDHLNVVRMYAVVVEPEALYLIMQFIEGESLDKTVERYVAQQTPMPVDLVLRIFHQVLDGVGAAHIEGVIHRDLKPANILIRQRDAVAKVTDFGIAKAEEDAQAGRGQTKGIIGSLLYMAPEQIKGRRDLDKRVDIYGLGILLYELLVGRVPFDAPSEFEIMKLHLEGQVPMISRMRSDVPSYIDAVIQRACAKSRDDRFASTQEMSTALREGQAAQEVARSLPATAEGAPAPEALVSPQRPAFASGSEQEPHAALSSTASSTAEGGCCWTVRAAEAVGGGLGPGRSDRGHRLGGWRCLGSLVLRSYRLRSVPPTCPAAPNRRTSCHVGIRGSIGKTSRRTPPCSLGWRLDDRDRTRFRCDHEWECARVQDSGCIGTRERGIRRRRDPVYAGADRRADQRLCGAGQDPTAAADRAQVRSFPCPGFVPRGPNRSEWGTVARAFRWIAIDGGPCQDCADAKDVPAIGAAR